MDQDQSKGTTTEETLVKSAEVEQPVPMPSTEKTPDSTPVADTAPEEELSLPENASERTREQFEKLKAKLREKEEALKAKEAVTPPKAPEPEPVSQYGDSVYSAFRPRVPEVTPAPQVDPRQFTNLSPQQVDTIQRSFVDDQGNVDVAGLNRTLQEAQQRAIQAEQFAQKAVQSVEAKVNERFSQMEEMREVTEAHQSHPELDPKNREKFNPQLFELVRDRILRNMYEGKKQPLGQVAAEMKKFVVGKPQETPQEVPEDPAKKQAIKNQAPLSVGKASQRTSGVELDDLRRRTREGDGAAITERLKRLGI